MDIHLVNLNNQCAEGIFITGSNENKANTVIGFGEWTRELGHRVSPRPERH